MTINFSANGVTKSVRSVQNELPYVMLSSVLPGYDPNVEGIEIAPWTLSQEIVNGVIKWKINGDVFTKLLLKLIRLMTPLFYSSSKNTFSFSGYDKDGNNINRQFLKNGNYHYLDNELVNYFNALMYASKIDDTREVSILFNGTVIQTYKLTQI